MCIGTKNEIAVEQPREPTAKPQPDEVSKDEGEDETESDSEDNQEPGTEEREVCHVNVIITMDDFPLSAVLAYYNVLYIQGMMSGEGFSVPSKDKVHDMLCKSEVTAVLQRCSTAYHVAKSGFDSCILSFLC